MTSDRIIGCLRLLRVLLIAGCQAEECGEIFRYMGYKQHGIVGSGYAVLLCGLAEAIMKGMINFYGGTWMNNIHFCVYLL